MAQVFHDLLLTFTDLKSHHDHYPEILANIHRLEAGEPLYSMCDGLLCCVATFDCKPKLGSAVVYVTTFLTSY